MRLAIEPEIIEQAKRVSGQKTFSATIDYAVRMFLPTVMRNLHVAGFRPNGATKYRNWPVTITTLEKIDKVSKRRGTSRAALIRALLVLKANEALTDAERSAEDSQFEEVLSRMSEPRLQAPKPRKTKPEPKPKSGPQRYTCNGETLTIPQWAKKLGRTHQRIRQRLEKYPVEIALYAVPHTPPHFEKRYTCNGETLTVREWAKKLGLHLSTLRDRLRCHPPEVVLSGNWERRRKQYMLDGQAMTLPQWAEKMGVNLDVAYGRLYAATGRIGAGRPGRSIEFNGETRTLVSWADKLGLTSAALVYRLKHYPIEVALSAPKGMASLRNSQQFLGSEEGINYDSTGPELI